MKDKPFLTAIVEDEWHKKQMQQNRLYQIRDDIISGEDKYFGYAHFAASNMADYTLMSTTIEDMVAVYGIEESQAAEIIMYLTH